MCHAVTTEPRRRDIYGATPHIAKRTEMVNLLLLLGGLVVLAGCAIALYELVRDGESPGDARPEPDTDLTNVEGVDQYGHQDLEGAQDRLMDEYGDDPHLNDE